MGRPVNPGLRTLPPPPKPLKLAENITVDRRGLVIDGRRLPFYLAMEPIKVSVEEGVPAKINLTLLADSVSIDPNTIVATPEGDVIMLEETQ